MQLKGTSKSIKMPTESVVLLWVIKKPVVFFFFSRHITNVKEEEEEVDTQILLLKFPKSFFVCENLECASQGQIDLISCRLLYYLPFILPRQLSFWSTCCPVFIPELWKFTWNFMLLSGLFNGYKHRLCRVYFWYCGATNPAPATCTPSTPMFPTVSPPPLPAVTTPSISFFTENWGDLGWQWWGWGSQRV